MIRTVLGDIAPETLGRTLMHEHIICDITPPSLRGVPGFDAPITMQSRFDIDYGRKRHTAKFQLLDQELAIAEVASFAEDGGQAIVELTIGGLDPDPVALAEISRATGVAIIMGCGHYTEEFQAPANHDRTVEDFAAEMIAAVRTGAWGTDIRAGIIGEIGCSAPWTALERRVMTAAVLAQQETGASITIHPGVDPDQPAEIIAFIRALGGDVSRTIIDHVDRTIFDTDRLLRLADTGCVLELDLFGYEHAYWSFAPVDMPNDGQRIQMLRALADAGHGDRMLISQDICRLTRLRAFGGHGYGHILRNVAPLMLERGFSAAEVDQVLVHSPRRLLTFA
ncbi:phosphotriesterase family protein [Humitalea sp. 24SJ18S-53]|uniref:phosphotriesterase family protein n=1 Tax=Humitalea sp. 24SJ18S-53 TaxID=3422307 RepID=UPI003D675A1D